MTTASTGFWATSMMEAVQARVRFELGDALKKGGEEMIRSEGEMARILFAAGSGLSALTEVQSCDRAGDAGIVSARGQQSENQHSPRTIQNGQEPVASGPRQQR